MIKNKSFRKDLVSKSHYWFFHYYFHLRVKYPTANFQKEIFELTNSNKKYVVATAFRGSSKTSIMSMSFPIWSVIAAKRKKNVLVICFNKDSGKRVLLDIRHELEANQLLINDFGPFYQGEEWTANDLSLPAFNAKISAASTEEGIRGTRHLHYRPDLIILDDFESLEGTRSKEGRDRTYEWLTRNIIPLGDLGTQYFMIGSILHSDSTIMRMAEKIKSGDIQNGSYVRYPIKDENGQFLWPGKFENNAEEMEELKKIDEVSWQNEYMLDPIGRHDAIIQPNWVKFYDKLPSDNKLRYSVIGIDLAISEESSAHFTAMVAGRIYGWGKEKRLYILPNPVEKKLNFPDSINTTVKLYQSLKNGRIVKIMFENVAYQKAFGDQLKENGIKSEAVQTRMTKETRLLLTSNWVKEGRILFPQQNCENLIRQLVDFGKEKYDDLADAFSLAASEAMKVDGAMPEVCFID